jgi:transposase
MARELGGHPQTVRERRRRFNAEGVDGRGDRPGPGRRPRLTQDARRHSVARARRRPPGAILRQPAGILATAAPEADAPWRLPALTAAARGGGIPIGRSQVRRILGQAGVRWRGVHPWAERDDPAFVPQGLPAARSTAPREDRTVIGSDELGPLTPRTDPPAAGGSPDGYRRKAPLDYRRGPEQVWGDGALRPRAGHALTPPGRARHTAGEPILLAAVAAANPTGARSLITANRSSHQSPPIVAWLAAHPRVQPGFLPVGAGGVHLPAGWWRLFRREALAGQRCADGAALAPITALATTTLHARAHPWGWGSRPRPPRSRRRRLVYLL